MAQLPPRISELFAEVQGHHDNPLAQLLAAQALVQELDHWLADLVAEARGKGVTWTTIGLCLGVTPQAVQKRFKGKGRVDVGGEVTISVGAGIEPAITFGWSGVPDAEGEGAEGAEVGKKAKKAKKAAKKAAAQAQAQAGAHGQGQPAGEGEAPPSFDPFGFLLSHRLPGEETEAQPKAGNPLTIILEDLRKQGDLDQLAGIKVAMKVAEDLASSGLFVKAQPGPGESPEAHDENDDEIDDEIDDEEEDDDDDE